MIARLLLAAALAAVLAAALAVAAEPAFTARATELKERAGADARTLATLPGNTAVQVLERGGAWTRVQAGERTGWVRVFHLRFPAAVESTASSSSGGLAGLGAALGLGGGARHTTLATTGIRGLSQEDLQAASPDPEALRRLQSYRADRESAERFAREAKLAAVHVPAPEARP